MNKTFKKQMVKSLIFLAFALTFGFLCRFERFSYMIRPLSAFVTSGLNYLTSLVSFSLAQIVLPAFFLGNFLMVIHYIIKKEWYLAIPKLIFALTYVYFTFTFLHGYAFNLPPISENLPYKIEKHNLDTLVSVTEQVISDLNAVNEKIERDENGVVIFDNLEAQTNKINNAYYSLMEKYNFTQRKSLGKIKSAGILSVPMSYWNTSGFYFMFLGEATVTSDMVATHIPYIMAHEQAHTLGIARENEANFFAFLASMESNDPELKYSALLNAYVYASNAVYSADAERHSQLSNIVNQDTKADLERLNNHLKRYETPIKEVGDSFNDAMLKSNGQVEGIKTYGYMTDLLISYYLSK